MSTNHDRAFATIPAMLSLHSRIARSGNTPRTGSVANIIHDILEKLGDMDARTLVKLTEEEYRKLCPTSTMITSHYIAAVRDEVRLGRVIEPGKEPPAHAHLPALVHRLHSPPTELTVIVAVTTRSVSLDTLAMTLSVLNAAGFQTTRFPSIPVEL